MTPSCIQALYGLPKEHKAVEGHSLGLYEQGDYFIEVTQDQQLSMIE